MPSAQYCVYPWPHVYEHAGIGTLWLHLHENLSSTVCVFWDSQCPLFYMAITFDMLYLSDLLPFLLPIARLSYQKWPLHNWTPCSKWGPKKDLYWEIGTSFLLLVTPLDAYHNFPHYQATHFAVFAIIWNNLPPNIFFCSFVFWVLTNAVSPTLHFSFWIAFSFHLKAMNCSLHFPTNLPVQP